MNLRDQIQVNAVNPMAIKCKHTVAPCKFNVCCFMYVSLIYNLVNCKYCFISLHCKCLVWLKDKVSEDTVQFPQFSIYNPLFIWVVITTAGSPNFSQIYCWAAKLMKQTCPSFVQSSKTLLVFLVICFYQFMGFVLGN